MTDNLETLIFNIDENNVAKVTINRPDKLNALNRKVLEELSQVCDRIADNRNLKGVIITGAGDKAFVAGADIRELQKLDEESGVNFSKYGQNVFNKIEQQPVPVVAAVNGYALGGGAELAMACHLRVAADKAIIGLPEVSLGIIPGYGGTQRLTRLIGQTRAMEMILTGEPVNADEAYEFGLLNRVAPPADLMDETHGLLNQVMDNAPLATARAIDVVNEASESSLEEGLHRESEMFGRLCDTEDFKEGTEAFLKKRKADFKGK